MLYWLPPPPPLYKHTTTPLKKLDHIKPYRTDEWTDTRSINKSLCSKTNLSNIITLSLINIHIKNHYNYLWILHSNKRACSSSIWAQCWWNHFGHSRHCTHSTVSFDFAITWSIIQGLALQSSTSGSSSDSSLSVSLADLSTLSHSSSSESSTAKELVINFCPATDFATPFSLFCLEASTLLNNLLKEKICILWLFYLIKTK